MKAQEHFEGLDRQAEAKEVARLQERQTFNHQVIEEAFSHLASPLNPDAAESCLSGTALLIAAGAVGHVLGVKINPPLPSENVQRIKEPLEAIARSSRLRMRSVILRDNWWQQDCGPLVAYTQPDHQPVALLPVEKNGYEIFDPIEKSRERLSAKKAAILEPIAYLFYRPLPHRVKNPWTMLRFAFKDQTREIQTIVLTSLAVSLLGMLTPQAMAIIINQGIPDGDRSILLQVGLGLLVAALGTALFQLTQGFAIIRLETRSDASTQAALWDQLLKLPASFFRQYSTGDLTARVSSVSTIRRQFGGRTILNLSTSFFGLFYFGQLFYYNGKLATVAALVAIITVAVTSTFGVVLLGYVRSLLNLQGYVFGQTVQLINGIAKLHVADAENRAFAFWSKAYSQQVKLELKKQQIEDAIVVFNTIMPTLSSGVLFWLTIQLIDKAQTSGTVGLSLGTFLAFNLAFGNFINNSTNLSNTMTEALQAIPQWKRTKPILNASPEVTENKVNPGQLLGEIEIKQVSFRYRLDQPLILDQVSLSAKPGEFIALVGSSGGGKSTLFRLLLGFETPESGNIYYDQHDLSSLDVESLRRQLGVVLQNGQLFSASIFDNIACGARISCDEAWEAATLAGIADDIAAMPMQLHTVISEGSSNISVGQRQRLLIARALVLKPKILLFDEATSALDNRTQDLVRHNLETLQVTRIVIAHRLSTIRNANQIYVLDKGRMIQQGNFDELAVQKGLFAQLMARQTA
ncbi:NHLP bacteriocin export ABC transporter permease/ATPase subunit [Coleofasciculus sp. F4-SAH-05]|uniref:NHLP bacteriocin export ABC transporter permease/ATPase subunit n=1 Tax=Coleofasciculus sp. F4-SAH-05 TaxID=3069525 RepID=UPI003300CDE7